jgi:hypothetical protein
VSFDPAHARIRVWDRMADDLVERAIMGASTPNVTLGGYWVVAAIEGAGGASVGAKTERRWPATDACRSVGGICAYQGSQDRRARSCAWTEGNDAEETKEARPPGVYAAPH